MKNYYSVKHFDINECENTSFTFGTDEDKTFEDFKKDLRDSILLVLKDIPEYLVDEDFGGVVKEAESNMKLLGWIRFNPEVLYLGWLRDRESVSKFLHLPEQQI